MEEAGFNSVPFSGIDDKIKVFCTCIILQCIECTRGYNVELIIKGVIILSATSMSACAGDHICECVC